MAEDGAAPAGASGDGPGDDGPARPPLAVLLDLAPHPEGGWFRRTWQTAVPLARDSDPDAGPRPSATGIYYLLGPGEESRWHQVRSDELWLHHRGVPLLVSLGGAADRPGPVVEVVLGPDVEAGERPQVLVPAGTWQAARPAVAGTVLVSCVVSPGFDFADWRLLPD